MRAGRGKVVVSVTTVPWRLPFLASTLRRLLSQSSEEFAIHCSVPAACCRTGEPYVLPNDVRALVDDESRLHLRSIAADFGPATKLLAPLREGLSEGWPIDTCIITVDDDVILEHHAIEELVERAPDYPDTVIGFMGRREDEFVHAETLAAGAERDRLVDVLGGYRGILYPLGVLDDSLFDDHAGLSAHGAPFLDDDYLIAWNLARRGILRRVIATRHPGPEFRANFELLDLPGPLTVGADGGPAIADSRRRLIEYYRRNRWDLPESTERVATAVRREAGRTPLVSVFTAACDSGERIRRPYESLLAQTTEHWEWVVVDDSSSAATAELVSELARSPQAAGRVRLECHPAPSGSIGATKADAAALASGELLVELDHDDELLPDALAMVTAAFAAEPPVDFVYSDFVDLIDNATLNPATYPYGWGFGYGAYASEMIGDRRLPVGLSPPITWATIRHIIAAPNHLRAWRTEFYRRIGGHSRDLPVADDYQLVVRSFLEGTVARIPRPLYVQYHHAEGANASRRRNPEIQRLVAAVAAEFEHALDRRCLGFALTPALSDASKWVDATPVVSANRVLDPAVDAMAAEGIPLVSVVIPTYRRPDLLRRALESVLAQTYENVEVLVVGDQCPDVDGVIGDCDDRRVRHWNLGAHHDDSGAAPRNYALKAMARGGFVAYLDDDNSWRADHLESLMELLLADPTTMFALASFEIDGEPIICRRPRQFQVDTSALVHRRFLLDRFGYWEPPQKVGYAHDWELVSRWAGEPWAASLEPTLRYELKTSAQDAEVVELIKLVAEEERRAALTPQGAA